MHHFLFCDQPKLEPRRCLPRQSGPACSHLLRPTIGGGCRLRSAKTCLVSPGSTSDASFLAFIGTVDAEIAPCSSVVIKKQCDTDERKVDVLGKLQHTVKVLRPRLEDLPSPCQVVSALLGARAAMIYQSASVSSSVGIAMDTLRTSFSSIAPIEELSTHRAPLSLFSALMFISSIRGLNKHSTAQRGVTIGIIATALGIASVLISPGFNSEHVRFLCTFVVAGLVGSGVALTVKMEEMPQLVAGFHSFVGLSAVFVGFANLLGPELCTLKVLEAFVGASVGALTFTGSAVAAGKLHGIIPGRPIVLSCRWLINGVGLASSLVLSIVFASPGHNMVFPCMVANTLIWGVLGANLVLPIGGADMPVVVSLLNAFSGLSTSAAGFMLSNNLLTITGALVASSGTLLSDIMCRGINRSMVNVLLGGFGTDDSTAVAEVTGTVREISSLGCVGILMAARRIVIVPGYGLAVARCQNKLGELVKLLRDHGVTVHFAIHPVAGRLPGHMNVLLAEASVPYDIVREMDDISEDMPQYDVALVVGANDTVNPATSDPGSPIYGMPVIKAWESKTCIVLKRSMCSGYSGIANPLFYCDNVRMLFGDAKQTIDSMFTLLEEKQSEIRVGVSHELDSHKPVQVAVEYPAASMSVGVITERRDGEKRVSVTPSLVPKLRLLGFKVLLEAGAGMSAGFTDRQYEQQGGVQVNESAEEVLKQADIILKVNEPMLQEVQLLSRGKVMLSVMNMYNTVELVEALRGSQATLVNLALVPRISRAQKLDALTSMANIAGYRAVIEAFYLLPRFSRTSVTASGTVPPARIFVIGAGVAGLSAIATARSLGAEVLANDVRDAVREQVESMGATFVPVDAQGIQGEGSGGYASEMGEDFRQAQLATYARIVKDVDIVVTTGQIPNSKAPVVISEAMVRTMRGGSVIVDLAAPTGGNCELSQRDRRVTVHDVTIIAETNFPSAMPALSSELLGNNFVAMLDVLGGADDFGQHWEDPLVQNAIVVRDGDVCWPPPTNVATSSSDARTTTIGVQPSLPHPVAIPDATKNAVVDWIKENQEELSIGVGAAVATGLGLLNIPEAELAHLGYFVLSLLIGNFTVANVTPALHTPLISVTNAISGIIVVGGMLQLSGPLVSAKVACSLAAVFLSSVNIVGGFVVTQRMVDMFRHGAD